jgi:hypothetical protein
MLHARHVQGILTLCLWAVFLDLKKTSYLEMVCSVGSPDLKQLQGCWTGEKHVELRYQ